MTIPIPADLGTPEPEEIVEVDHVVVWVYQNNRKFRMRVYGPYDNNKARRVQRDLDEEARRLRTDRFTMTYVRKMLTID